MSFFPFTTKPLISTQQQCALQLQLSRNLARSDLIIIQIKYGLDLVGPSFAKLDLYCMIKTVTSCHVNRTHSIRNQKLIPESDFYHKGATTGLRLVFFTPCFDMIRAAMPKWPEEETAISNICDGMKKIDNRPFYSCVLSDLALNWKRGWG